MGRRHIDADRAFIDFVRRDRVALQEQIRLSRITIEESRALLRRMDEITAKAEKKE
jgi:hypothetical protein